MTGTTHVNNTKIIETNETINAPSSQCICELVSLTTIFLRWGHPTNQKQCTQYYLHQNDGSLTKCNYPPSQRNFCSLIAQTEEGYQPSNVALQGQHHFWRLSSSVCVISCVCNSRVQIFQPQPKLMSCELPHRDPKVSNLHRRFWRRNINWLLWLPLNPIRSNKRFQLTAVDNTGCYQRTNSGTNSIATMVISQVFALFVQPTQKDVALSSNHSQPTTTKEEPKHDNRKLVPL